MKANEIALRAAEHARHVLNMGTTAMTEYIESGLSPMDARSKVLAVYDAIVKEQEKRFADEQANADQQRATDESARESIGSETSDSGSVVVAGDGRHSPADSGIAPPSDL